MHQAYKQRDSDGTPPWRQVWECASCMAPSTRQGGTAPHKAPHSVSPRLVGNSAALSPSWFCPRNRSASPCPPHSLSPVASQGLVRCHPVNGPRVFQVFWGWSWGVRVFSGVCLGVVFGCVCVFFLGCCWGAFWGVLGFCCGVLGVLGCVLGSAGVVSSRFGVFGASGGHFGHF